MKELSLYKKLNLSDENKVFEYFTKTLRESIFTWDYFVDWDKIVKKVEELETEMNILNSLIGKKDSEDKFIQLVKKYPDIKKALPLLIAVRIQKLRNLPISINKDIDDLRAELKKNYFSSNSKVDSKTESELIAFYQKSGLKNLIENKNVKNLVDYYTGVEVGMDTNARKNRVGFLMEDIIENFLSKMSSENKDIDFITQANSKKIKEKWDISVEMDKSSRRFDFAVFNKKSEKLFLIETNFYSGGGTKLKATAGEYSQLNDFLNQQNFTFIWITDGLGWKTSNNSLRETFNSNEYTFNLALLKEGAFKELLFNG